MTKPPTQARLASGAYLKRTQRSALEWLLIYARAVRDTHDQLGRAVANRQDTFAARTAYTTALNKLDHILNLIDREAP